MKKFRVLSSVLASALMMTVMSCSSSDDLKGGGADANDKSYLAIRINNVGSVAGSRAAGDYSDGTADENHIESVRFYFFNSDGTPYILKENGQSTGKNWLEKSDNLNTGNKDNPNVSMISNPLLVIEGNTGASPAVMIAVINPKSLDGDKLGNGAKTLDDVKRTSIFSQFYTTDKKNFVMSNSVYVDNGVEKCTSIVTGHVATDPDKAKDDPVDLYVERVVAKVQPTIDANYAAADGRKWEKINGKDAMKVGVYGTNDIYAVVDGWGVADEDGKAELVKQVKTDWTDTSLGIEVWTTPNYHRCFWTSSVAFAAGINGAEGNVPVNHSYNKFAARKLTDCAYTLPNAPTSVNTDPYASTLTKMVLATHLVYKDGSDYKPAEICQYRGQEYLHIADVKTEVANNFADYYIKKGDTRTKLKPSDIDFTTKVTGIKDYQVVATLRSLAADETLQKKTGTTEEASSYQNVNKEDLQNLMNTEPAQIRKDGMAYYFIPIRHLGTDPTKLGYYGIVRNHVYSINIQNMYGFGTPVYDPDKTIDPTIPSNDATYLAARINVLSWRVVKYNADLDKTK